jgi:hypothetical protein
MHGLPGLDACLRFASLPTGRVALTWDPVFVAAVPVIGG